MTFQPPTSALFAPTTRRVAIEIDYGPGAEPYVGRTASIGDPWNVFRDNANAIFGGAKEVVFPSRLSDMERLDDVEGASFGERELIAIADRHRNTRSTRDTVAFYVVFLAGQYRDDDGTRLSQVVGVSVRGTGIIGIFKPSVTSGLHEPATPVFMEQATLVHEFGHAVGLVDDGIPATTAHRAVRRGVHCDNPGCIMYWENVLVKDGVDFVDTYLEPRHGVLFGPECLADVRAFAGRDGRARP